MENELNDQELETVTGGGYALPKLPDSLIPVYPGIYDSGDGLTFYRLLGGENIRKGQDTMIIVDKLIKIEEGVFQCEQAGMYFSAQSLLQMQRIDIEKPRVLH